MTNLSANLPVQGSVADGAAIQAALGVHVIAGSDGSNYQVAKVDSNGNGYAYITDGTNTASILDGTNDALRVSISDGENDVDVLTVNSAYGATPTGLGIFGKYEATPTTYDDGDAVPLLTDDKGRLITISADSAGAIAETYTHGSALLQVGGGATSIVSYSPTSDTEYISGFIVSGSGAMFVQAQFGTTGSEADMFVFYNSVANPNIIYNLPLDLDIASTETLDIVGTNVERAPSTGSDYTAYGTIASHT